MRGRFSSVETDFGGRITNKKIIPIFGAEAMYCQAVKVSRSHPIKHIQPSRNRGNSSGILVPGKIEVRTSVYRLRFLNCTQPELRTDDVITKCHTGISSINHGPSSSA